MCWVLGEQACLPSVVGEGKRPSLREMGSQEREVSSLGPKAERKVLLERLRRQTQVSGPLISSDKFLISQCCCFLFSW